MSEDAHRFAQEKTKEKAEAYKRSNQQKERTRVATCSKCNLMVKLGVQIAFGDTLTIII